MDTNPSIMHPRLISRAIGNESGSELCVLMIPIAYVIQDDSVRCLIWMATPNPSATPTNMHEAYTCNDPN